MNSDFKANAEASGEVSERIQRLSPAKRALLELKLKKAMGEKLEKDTIPKRKERETAPLSFAQQRLWFLYQLEPESPYYNIPVAWRLKGQLYVEAIHQALNTIVGRHEALRTTFIMSNGEPAQKIAQNLNIDLPVIDLAADEPIAREAALERLCTEEASWVFDLENGPLLRCSLFRLEAEDHVLMLNMHHIISDGWSLEVFRRELWASYTAFSEGHPSPLVELPIQYADYAQWQRKWFKGEVLDKQLRYWKKQLAGAPPVLELPTDRPRPSVQSFQGARHQMLLPASLLESLKALSREAGVTLFMTLLAAFQMLLHRYTGQDDILVGSPIAGRSRSEVENLIGFFVNTLVLRTHLAGNPTFRELLGRVREVALGAYEHQELPFEKLVEALKPERNLSHNPLIQVMFALHNTHQESSKVSQLKILPKSVGIDSAKFDLTLNIQEVANELRVLMEYNTDLFDQTTIIRMIVHFQTLLEGIVSSPEKRVSELPILRESERHQLLVAWNNTVTDYPKDLCFHQLFEIQAVQTPEAVALEFDGDGFSYCELDTRANRLANYLIQLGVGPQTLVGICLQRSEMMVVAMLGILKAGAAYVPMDPSYPVERLVYMLKDSQAAVLLTEFNLLPQLSVEVPQVVYLSQDWPAINACSHVSGAATATPEDLAYIIYTSGSTGQPKGVQVPHRTVVNFLNSMAREPGLTDQDILLAVTTLSFDISVLEIFLPLVAGAKVVIASREAASDGFQLQKLLTQSEATVMQATPATWRALVDAGWQGNNRLKVFCGGEAISLDLVRELVTRSSQVWNMYGPTETTVWSTCYHLVDPDGPVLIGKPIANTKIYLLDHHQQPVPVGVPGELYIGGDGVVRGYMNRVKLTSERFVADPFSCEPNARMYRTGDLARYQPDGNIECLGRIDHQVKIRGFRIELGEIETVIRSHPVVQTAVVIVREDIPDDKRLTAYIVEDSERRLDSGELRNFLKQKLPEYMIPSAFIVLEAMPLLPNGKVNRSVLPVPNIDTIRSSIAYVEPRTPAEKTIADIWSSILRIPLIGIRDNFFGLGGHSLLAVKMISRVRSAFQVEVPLRALFEAPSIAEFVDKINDLQLQHSITEEKSILPDQLAHENTILISKTRSNPNPLSFAQQRLWFLYQLKPDSPFYNYPVAWRLKGTLNVEALHEALNGIVGRHESLRTTFFLSDDEPRQRIAQSLTIDFPVVDLYVHGPDAREAAVHQLCMDEAQRVFDLEEGPLLRCLLIRLEAEEHVLMLNMHHIISDEWSIEVFGRELWVLYEAFSKGQPSPLAELPIQYADYAQWQRKWFKGEVLNKQLRYWKEQLAGAPPVLELPTDRPHPTRQSFRGAHHTVTLPANLLEGLKALSRETGSTLFMTLLSAFQLLLHRYTGQDDILVGAPIAGRNCEEVENLIGFFVNTLVIRTNLADNPTFRKLIGRVQEVAIGAYEHQDLPFEKLVEELKPERNIGHNPLIQVMFALQNPQEKSYKVSKLKIAPESIGLNSAKFDLTLFMHEVAKGLRASFGYNRDLFDQTTIERMMGHFRTLLEGIVSDPDCPVSELPFLSESEHRQVLLEWNNTGTNYPKDLCVHQIFEWQTAQTPENVAVVFGKERLTYAQLNAKANKLAHYLRTNGVGPEKCVGICIERSLEMIVGLLGILKAGGAYVPLDPAYPVERLTLMIEDAHVEMLLTQKKLQNRFPEFTGPVVKLDGNQERIDQESEKNLSHAGSGDQLAYVMYTSGSTGRPKGVAVVHRGIVRLVKETDYVDLSPDEVILQFAPISFDASTFEIWGALLNGARLVIFPNHLPSLQEIVKVLKRYGVTTLWLTAGLFHQMVTNHLEGLKPIRQLLAGGDVLSAPLVIKALETLKGCRLINGYGPTENTTFTCCHVMTDPQQVGSSVPIGRPIANTQVYILDNHLQPVPIGVAGELYIGGDGLARGYFDQPELTQEKFIANPFSIVPDSRLYKSGDLVRYRVDGTIEFLGRKDTQVKIRGFRVELGEIEAVIAAHPSVREVAAIVREDVPGDKRIAAYVVFKAGKSMDVESLRAYLQNKTPEYMVPSAIVTLDVLPLNANGKVDRKELPVPNRNQTVVNLDYQAPRDSLEIQLSKIWEKALGVGSVGIRDNFFDLGGHSLLAIQMLSQIKKYTGKEIAVADLFKHPTVEQLAEVLRSEGWSSPFSLLLPFQPLGTKPPFFCIHGGAAEAANLIGFEQPFYGAFPHGYFGDPIPATVEEMAAEYVKEIRIIQPMGPYFIGGYSFGGMLAFEIAHQLIMQGQEIRFLALFDATSQDNDKKPIRDTLTRCSNKSGGKTIFPKFFRVGGKFSKMNIRQKQRYVFAVVYKYMFQNTGIAKMIKICVCKCFLKAGLPVPNSLRFFYQYDFMFPKAARVYLPRKYPGSATLFCAEKNTHNPTKFWQDLVEKELAVYELPGGHHDLFKPQQVRLLVEKLKVCLERTQNETKVG